MKKIIILFLLTITFPSLFAVPIFTDTYSLCRDSIKKAQISSYLRTVGSVEYCSRPKIANPVGMWNCSEKRNNSCKKKWITCSREYDCQFMNKEVNKKVILEKINDGVTTSLFLEYTKTLKKDQR